MNTRTHEEIPHRGWLAAAGLLLLAALVLPAPAAAAEQVGRAISSSGDVTAFRAGESARSLNRGDPVYEGDEIRTGPNGRAQVRFVDQGLTNLSPSTTLAVDEYRIEDDDADGGGSAVLSFLRGAMRTITGLIGDNDEDTYRMNTPTATIGVRGTGYALQYCDAACAQEFGGQPGLYGRVDDGAIRVDTPRGSTDFGSGSYFFVPDGGGPRGILQPPGGVLDGGEDEGRGDGGDTGDGVAIIPVGEQDGDDILLTAGDFDETDFEAGDEFLSKTGLVGAGVSAVWGGGTADTELYGDPKGFTTDGDGNVDSATFSDRTTTTIAVDGAKLVESGFVDGLSVSWGRWNGQFKVNNEPTTGNMAFAVTDNLAEPETLGNLAGSIDYNLAGGPSGFGTDGTLWPVDKFSLNVNFDASTNPITLNSLVLIDQSGDYTDAIFDSTNTAGSTLDLANNSLVLNLTDSFQNVSTIEGKFVGVGAEGMIVNYEINNVDVIIYGTSILKQ